VIRSGSTLSLTKPNFTTETQRAQRLADKPFESQFERWNIKINEESGPQFPMDFYRHADYGMRQLIRRRIHFSTLYNIPSL
jgi:hypothetical protein